MKRMMMMMNNVVDDPGDEYDDFELPDDAHYNEPEEEIAPGRQPVAPSEMRAALGSLIASALMFMFCIYRTGIGMYGHSGAESLAVVRWLMFADVPVIVLGARALVATRPHEGTPIRGAAIAASAISFIIELVLANSLWVLLDIDSYFVAGHLR